MAVFILNLIFLKCVTQLTKDKSETLGFFPRLMDNGIMRLCPEISLDLVIKRKRETCGHKHATFHAHLDEMLFSRCQWKQLHFKQSYFGD